MEQLIDSIRIWWANAADETHFAVIGLGITLGVMVMMSIIARIVAGNREDYMQTYFPQRTPAYTAHLMPTREKAFAPEADTEEEVAEEADEPVIAAPSQINPLSGRRRIRVY